MRKIFFLIVILGVSAAFYFGLSGSHRILIKTTFAQLPDWKQANHVAAFTAFQKSCVEILRKNPTESFGNNPQNGKNADWQRICQAALALKQVDQQVVQAFFENWFQPYRVANNFQARGMFTGYYLPLIHASLKQDAHYVVPIYGVPKKLGAN